MLFGRFIMADGLGGEKRDYIWNTAAGLINASEAVVMSMVVTHMTGLADAGMLMLAFAVGNLMMTIGKFGVRNYQVTDVGNQFSFSTYLVVRLITVALMVLLVCGYLHVMLAKAAYGMDKASIIFAICMIYAVEALEDVMWGYYQHRNRLYVGAAMFCIRWTGILLVFPVALYISRNIVLALWICLGVSVVIFGVLMIISSVRLCNEADRSPTEIFSKVNWRQVRELFGTVFPLFGITFLSFYVNNVPKYAIDVCLTDEVQACYGFVAMPIFVIGLLSNFIYQPTLVPIAVEWDQGSVVQFKQRINRQLIIIGVLTVACMAGAYVFGIPVLSLVYNTNLAGYKSELMILLLASGFLAVSEYQCVILTIMRHQKVLLWSHCTVAIIATCSLPINVSRHGTLGAAFCYLVLMIILCLLYEGILVIKLKSDSRNFGKEK